MIYRYTEDKDKVAVMGVLKLSFDSTYAYYAQKSFASLENSLVADDAGAIAGVVNWRIYEVNGDKIGYIFWMAVHPDHRRRGIGEDLILEVVNQIHKEIGPSDIYSAVEKDNEPMRKLFSKLGFTPDGRAFIRKNYGLKRLQLYSQMMLTPWEDLFIKRKGIL